ncbi:hypothetical protein DXF93_21810 [Escherichia coli]|nr:hypothetical protein DXF93_21810 [Escherichia coli]
MTEKRAGVNWKIIIMREECSAKMKKVHGGMGECMLMPSPVGRGRIHRDYSSCARRLISD